jgi:hypothetical protein
MSSAMSYTKQQNQMNTVSCRYGDVRHEHMIHSDVVLWKPHNTLKAKRAQCTVTQQQRAQLSALCKDDQFAVNDAHVNEHIICIPLHERLHVCAVDTKIGYMNHAPTSAYLKKDTVLFRQSSITLVRVNVLMNYIEAELYVLW